jgi:hypothetical protein
MVNSTRIRALAGLLLAVVVIPATASAQRAPRTAPAGDLRRPYRGLFGGNADPTAPQSLTFIGSVFEGYDDNVYAGLTGRRTDDRTGRSGTYSGASTALTYTISHNGERVTLSGSTTAQAAYYYTTKWNVAPYYNGDASARVQLSRSLSLTGTYGIVVSRYYRFLLNPDLATTDTTISGGDIGVPGDEVDPTAGELDAGDVGNDDLDLLRRPTLRHSAGVSLSRKFGNRSALTAGYRLRYIDFIGGDRNSYRSQSGSIDFNRKMTAHATLNLGYAYKVADWNTEGRNNRTVQNINIGVNYARSLSFSRRTTVSFSTGSAIVSSDNLTTPQIDTRTRFRAVGNASLTHEMGRSWTADVVYSRAVLFREGFDTPFYTDGVAAGIAGVPARRVNVSAGAHWALASTDIDGNSSHRGTGAFAQASYAISRFLAAYVRYIYYSYRFGEDIPLDADFPRALDRQGVRIGLTTSIPLIR